MNPKQKENPTELIITYLWSADLSELATTSPKMIAAKFGYQLNDISSKFKKAIDRSLPDYIDFVRIVRAAMLLKNKKLPVKEIGRMVGLGNPVHFRRCFKSFFLAAPTKFRKHFFPDFRENPLKIF